MNHLVGAVGRWTLRVLAAGAKVAVLMVDTATWLVVAPLKGKGLRILKDIFVNTETEKAK